MIRAAIRGFIQGFFEGMNEADILPRVCGIPAWSIIMTINLGIISSIIALIILG